MSVTLERPTPKAKPRRKRAAAATLTVIDCDIHPGLHSTKELFPFLTKRWQQHLINYAVHFRTPYTSTTPYPRSAPLLARRDAWPPSGRVPGADLDFMRVQHLDELNVEYGVLQVLDSLVFSLQNLDFSAAMAGALNDWQAEVWSRPEPRLKASVLVPQEDAPAAVKEIERRAPDKRFVQVNLSPRVAEPIGRKRYWPIYAAVQAAGLPIGIHVGGYGGHAPTASGYPSYYNEEHHSNAHSMASSMTSLVIEGVLERFPKLRFLFIEGGFGWVPSAAWRMDKHIARFRDEVPHLRRMPSEYVKQHFWFTTQPIEEPERTGDMRTLIDWIGWDRLLFSSDYPHWDFDDPRTAFKLPLSEAERRAVLHDNAARFYGLGGA
jgi:hypothetical protein